ncbi:MAG: glutathione S-transferase family protein [Pseudomonadota bacterium]
MKLYLNTTSPYARLVTVVAYEKGLNGAIERVLTDPWASPDELLAVNPFAKVPALVTDDGEAIIDSGSICLYLDDAGGGRALLPAAGAERSRALAKLGLGRSLIDCAFGVTIEKRFANGGEPALASRWHGAVERAVGHLEREAPRLGAPQRPDLGDLAIAVGLGYVAFRLPEVGWRDAAARLAAWYDGMTARPSLAA